MPNRKSLSNLEWPSPEEFRKVVEDCEEKWAISDCIYNQSVKEFSRIRMSQLNEKHKTRIIRPFLLIWGSMGRVLGREEGIKAVSKKLKEIGEKVEPLRQRDLLSADLNGIKDPVIELFDEIRETRFRSPKGKQKPVGSTAASKVLHLACPNLFVMWDSEIRRGYKKHKGDGKEYFEFLCQMKDMWKKLETTIKSLQQKYGGKRITRMLDEYNWVKNHYFGAS